MGVYTLQETIFRNARRAGLSEIGEVDISVLRHEGWVRKLCEENASRNYSTNWACPPAVGTLEECRERCRSFDHMLLFNKVYTLRDSYDLEGMYDSMRMFRHTVDRFDWFVGSLFSRKLFLANGACGNCPKCAWPDEPCRFPDRLHHSIEGYGFNIMKLAEHAGIEYSHGYKTITLFGALFYCE